MAKGEINLPEVKVTGEIPQGTVNLPETKIEANPTPPPGHINVINPQGQLGHVPLDWLLKDGLGQGFKLAAGEQRTPGSADLTPDKQVRVIRKADGQPGTLPLDWFLKDPAAKDFDLASQADPSFLAEHQRKVNQDLADLNKREEVASIFDASAGLNLSARHKNDDVMDKEGNFKLIGPDGSFISVPPKHVTALLASKAGFRFQDDNAQALYEAYQKQDNGVSGSIWSGMGGLTEILPFHDKGKFTEKMLKDQKTDLVNKMERIDEDIRNSDSTAYKVGQGLGIAAQVLTPGGALGEGRLAQAAGAAALAKLAPEGASLGRQILARGLSTALEGAIVSSPQALSQLAVQENPKAAAESLALGAGIGFFLGAGTKTLAAGVEKGADLLRPLAVSNALEKAGANAESLAAIPGAANKEAFLQTLLDKGLSPKSKGEEVTKVITDLAQGERLAPTLQKLDKVAETPISAPELLSTFDKATQDLVKADSKIQPVLDSLGERLNKLTDAKAASGAQLDLFSKNMSISLENLQKFVGELGTEINWKKLSQPAEMAKARVWQAGLSELMQAGDKAALQADAKVAAAWTQQKAITEIAQQMQSSILKEPQEVLNPLVKAITHGLSDKLTGVITGAAIGGPIGAAIGGMANKSILKPALTGLESNLIEKYASNPDHASKLGNWLVRNKTADAIGSYLILDAVKVKAHNIEAIPAFLRNIGEKTPSMFLGTSDPIKTILGPEANGLSKNQQYQRLSTKVSSLAGNPELRQKQFDTFLAPILKDHPQLANQVYTDYDQKIQAINQIVNGHNKQQPEAFVKNKPENPTPAQMREIESQLKIAMNPYALLDGLKNGKVTAKQVAIAAQLNPAILQDIRTELNKEAFGGKINLTYQQRLSASIIMGTAMDQSLRNGQALQAAYGNNANAAAPAPVAKSKKSGNSKPLHADKISPFTTSQRISK